MTQIATKFPRQMPTAINNGTQVVQKASFSLHYHL